MSAGGETMPREMAKAWIENFNRAVISGDVGSVQGLFAKESYWRNLLGIGWAFGTTSGRDVIAQRLVHAGNAQNVRDVQLDESRLAVTETTLAGQPVIQAVVTFQTNAGRGIGVVRLLRPGGAPEGLDDLPKAWTLMTALEELELSGARQGARTTAVADADHTRRFAEPNWLDRRREEAAFADRDPEVLIVGGGHAGLTAAVELKQLGIDTLVIDKEERIGDNWRLRYHSLKLHNKTPVNHLPYMPFPKTFPDYIPKDKVANWLEQYVDSMEINFWTQTAFEGAEYDEPAQGWVATVRLKDGSVREMRPRHIIMATSVSGTPKIPKVPTLDEFNGKVIHSSQYANGAQWKGLPVVVMGTGTSAHDICQDLHAHGARVTMVQRSPTMIVNVDPSAQLYDQLYLGDGPPIEDRDLVNSSIPFALVKRVHQAVTKQVRELDAPLLKGLEKAGFELEFGDEDSGWPLKFRQRGGGYYFNVGCSELIVSGEIALIQNRDIETFIAHGIAMADGSKVQADLLVLATGYETQQAMVRELFSPDVGERVGQIWGFDEATRELASMWMQTGQPGLWFTGGAFSQCRIYSKYLAFQIAAIEHGMMPREKPRP